MTDNPFQPSERSLSIQASGIRKFFELGLSMKDPVDLSIGQAHFEVPEVAQQAAMKAIADGKNRYTVTQGIPELREKLKARMAANYGDIDGTDLMVTSGVSGALLLAFMALLNPGDEILIPDPYFVMYRHLASMVGATAKTYSTYPEFRVSADVIREQITPKTKLIIVNSPSNPTGATLSKKEARDLAKLADETGIALISDEIYEDFHYNDEHHSPRQYTENCIVVAGASKFLGMPGWRIGWMLAPQDICERMYALQQFSFVCAPAPLQWGALAALDIDFTQHREEYRAKRDFVIDGLKENFQIVKPEGAFYMFPQLPEGAEPEAFLNACIERELLVVPGGACSERNTHFRLCYATTDEKLKRAVTILNEIAN
ncbi:pyridoxal phosphate-dependent aminotransferase [Planctomycetota bacterium]|nr:pyridoxal phosphate-dependent aminotransferase [Planctomycetota bacterium]